MDAGDGIPINCVVLLSVTFRREGAEAIAKYEWVGEREGYREWLVPAELINGRTLVDIDEVDDWGDPF